MNPSSEHSHTHSDGDPSLPCQVQIESLKKEVCHLWSLAARSNEQTIKLTNQVNFLLSAMGLTDGEDVPFSIESDGLVSSGEMVTDQPSEAHAESKSDGSSKPTESGKLNYAQALTRVRTAVVTAVHVESKSIQNRARNFVISGLRPEDDLPDNESVQGFIAQHWPCCCWYCYEVPASWSAGIGTCAATARDDGDGVPGHCCHRRGQTAALLADSGDKE